MVLVGWWGVWLCQDHLSLSAPSAQQTSGEGKVQAIAAAFEHPVGSILWFVSIVCPICVLETGHRNKPYASNGIFKWFLDKVSSYPPDLTALSSANAMYKNVVLINYRSTE